MYIISKFKDYYDHLAYLGIDKKVTYNRKTIDLYESESEYTSNGWVYHKKYEEDVIYFEKLLAKKFPPRHILDSNKRANGLPKRYWRSKNEPYIELGYIIICGKFYTLPFKVKENVERPYYPQHYELITHDQYRSEYKNKLPYEVELHYELDIDCKFPIIMKNPKGVFINPNLKEWGIQSYFNAQDIWQRLSMFLSPQENPTVEISNDSKILKAGFDLKNSFRNIKKKK